MRPVRPVLLVLLLALASACTDPRERPVPPQLDLVLSTGTTIPSPGQIFGSIHLFDEDGLFSIRITVATADSAFAGDSTTVFGGETETIRGLNWAVPAGLPEGTQITLAAEVEDFAGFVSRDTLLLVVDNTP